MRRVALAAIAFLGACSTPDRIQIKIVNATPKPLVLRASTRIFSYTLTVPAGTTWDGWIDRRMAGATAEVVVSGP